jgi:hypothetical protein
VGQEIPVLEHQRSVQPKLVFQQLDVMGSRWMTGAVRHVLTENCLRGTAGDEMKPDKRESKDPPQHWNRDQSAANDMSQH